MFSHCQLSFFKVGLSRKKKCLNKNIYFNAPAGLLNVLVNYMIMVNRSVCMYNYQFLNVKRAIVK